MKKIFLASAFSIFATGAFAQNAALEAQMREAQCKTAADDIAKNEKASADPKKGIKPATWLKLAQSYEAMAMSCGKDSMASAKAFETYQKAIEVDAAAGGKMAKEIEESKTKTLYNALMQQGAAYYNGKNYAGAIKLFGLASKTNPKDTTSALYLGIVGQQGKDNAAALKGFSDFLELGGKDPAVFYGLAELYRSVKNTAKAIETLKRGIKIHPKDKDLQGALVNIQLSGGNMDEAINEMKVLVDKDPENMVNTLNLAILYDNAFANNKNKPELRAEALKWYGVVLAKEPNNYDANYNLAVFHFNDAVEIKKSVDNMDMKTYQKEGKAVEDKVCDKFNEAKKYFDICKSTKPNEPDLVENLKNLDNVLTQCSGRKK
ncbi:MAG: tetratricopeptide repeat protein [Spirosomaceae bacterium]|jgi:tetratricopeptide (TPR) repeat protein|nr:tetratricopeptide repeat protein [Spirosomataceae bacterium]